MSKQQVGIQINDVGGLPHARFGVFPDGTIALRIAQGGIDVTQATPSQLVFSDEQIVGSYTFPAIASVSPSNTTNQLQIVPHNLGYIPSFETKMQVYNVGDFQISGFPPIYYSNWSYNAAFGDPLASLITNFLTSGVDNTNLYITRQAENVDSGSAHPASAITVYYRIFEYGSIT